MSTNTRDYHFDLPAELIAQYPLAERSASRLMTVDKSSGAIAHKTFVDIVSLLRPNDLLVFNNTRVIPARLFGQKSTGGRIEILIERIVNPHTVHAHIRSSRSPKPGAMLSIFNRESDAIEAQWEVIDRLGSLFVISSADQPIAPMIDRCGHMPLPPYIERPDELADQDRYQTVYAKREGAVAAPTAGLHFTHEVLDALARAQVATTEITLHVGAGTFQPVKEADIRSHEMHFEWLEVPQEVVEAVNSARASGGRIIAVGTTAARALEAASQSGELSAYQGDTNIFMYPGYTFQAIDGLVTNFHLPESTLIMLVSALAGREPILEAYREAVRERYRFFSYGDAMLIT
jgi:S-adenosylmethionine:tRNA ribosyltransferase-isomerase